MHEYTKDAIVGAAQRCEDALQLAHIFGRDDRFAGAYYAEKAQAAAVHAFQLAEIDARARAEFCGALA